MSEFASERRPDEVVTLEEIKAERTTETFWKANEHLGKNNVYWFNQPTINLAEKAKFDMFKAAVVNRAEETIEEIEACTEVQQVRSISIDFTDITKET